MDTEQKVIVLNVVLLGLFLFMAFAIIGGAIWVTRRQKTREKSKVEDTKLKHEQDLRNLLSWARWLFFWSTINLFLAIYEFWSIRDRLAAVALSYYAYAIGGVLAYYLTAILLWKRTVFVFIPFLIHIALLLIYPFFVNATLNLPGLVYTLIVGLTLLGFWQRGAFNPTAASQNIGTDTKQADSL